jgi:hypothetical protein
LDVTLTASQAVPKPFDQRSYALQEGETVEALMKRAALDISKAMDAVYKQPNLLQFDRAAQLSTIVPLTGMEDWLSVRDRLAKVPQVRRTEVVSLSREEAALVLHVVGDQEQVKAALASAGLNLQWGDGFWTMRPVGARR